MTVRQLIKLLADLPSDADVYLDCEAVPVPAVGVCMEKVKSSIPTNAPDIAVIS